MTGPGQGPQHNLWGRWRAIVGCALIAAGTVAMVATRPASAGTPICSDDFNRADSTSLGAQWVETSGLGDWAVSGNKLVDQTASTQSEVKLGSTCSIVAGYEAVTIAGPATAARGFGFWWVDQNNYYRAVYGGATTVVVVRRNAGNDVTLGSFPVADTTTAAHRLAVHYRSGLIEVYSDGLLIGSIGETPPWTSGSHGLTLQCCTTSPGLYSFDDYSGQADDAALDQLPTTTTTAAPTTTTSTTAAPSTTTTAPPATTTTTACGKVGYACQVSIADAQVPVKLWDNDVTLAVILVGFVLAGLEVARILIGHADKSAAGDDV